MVVSLISVMYHIVNLTFAIFCAIGRPIYRNSERFIVMNQWSLMSTESLTMLEFVIFQKRDFI